MRIILQITQLTKQITSMKELRQRNMDEAFAELGKDLYVTVVFKGKEKFYSWQDGSFGYKEKPEAEWELDPNADPLEMANQLEEMGREAVKMATRAIAN